jgi:hypothetical protein
LPDDAYYTANTKYKTDLAMVMAAYMNNRPIAFYVSGCTAYGNPIVGVVRVQ